MSESKTNPGAWMSATVGLNLETRKIFARKVYRCGYCGNLYPGSRCRCPQCKSKKLAETAQKRTQKTNLKIHQ